MIPMQTQDAMLRRQSMGGQQQTGEEARLIRTARLLEEALAQDDHQPRLDDVCPPQSGSADYDRRGPSAFDVSRVAPEPPSQLHCPAPGVFTRQGVLPDIQRLWRSFDCQLVLWKYTDPRAPDVMTYQDVTQQIVAVATARPKSFVSGVGYFLVISTPVEVSLHAIRFAPNSDRLLPLIRTRHVVATDDVAAGVIASDDSTGRIFLGGTDGCIHEMQYFGDEDLTWTGRPRKSRRSVVQWNVTSQMPGFLRRATCAMFGAPETIAQLVVDGNRGLLFALAVQPASSNQAGFMTSIQVFQVPASRRDADGRLDEPALIQLNTISVHQLASEVVRVKAQLFPGLAPPRRHFFDASGFAAAASAITGPRLKIAKLLPIDHAQGGDIVLCAVAEDGTRIFLRGVFRVPRLGGGLAGPGGVGASVPGGDSFGAAGSWVENAGGIASGSQPHMERMVVHHVRFLDPSIPEILVKDVVRERGVTLLLGQVASGAAQNQLALLPFGAAVGSAGLPGPSVSRSGDGDVLVAISTDLRVVAQRQSRGRTPWMMPQQGLAEQIEVVRLDGDGSTTCQAIALAAFSSQLPRALLSLYGHSPAHAMSPPVLKLSELAQQQLVPPVRFSVVSNLGVHVLTQRRPLDLLQQCLQRSELPAIRDFALEYTAEQTCALLFQLLSGAVVAPPPTVAAKLASAGMRPQTAMNALVDSERPPSMPLPFTPGGQALMPGVSQDTAMVPVEGYGQLSLTAVTDTSLNRGLLAMASPQTLPVGLPDPVEETTLARAEQLLLSPQSAMQMGFLQAWPAAEPQQGVVTWPSGLGHPIHEQVSQRVSGRLRGLSLYLSRILRPMWLTPIMVVAWQKRTDTGRQKRRRDDWWPAPPEPPPAVEGSQWRCTWSRWQRNHIHGQLLQVHAMLEKRKDFMAADSTIAQLGEGVGHQHQQPNDAQLVAGFLDLVITAIEAVDFLQLIASRLEALTTTSGRADDWQATLVRFSELTFRDLVCQPESRKVLQQLMRGGVVECHLLHSRCPHLFSAGELELQEAFELLTAAHQGLLAGQSKLTGANGAPLVDHVRLTNLVRRALRAFEKHASRIDIADVARKLRAVGAFRGLIKLCAQAARARDPRDESLQPLDPSSTRIQQLHYARLECYQIVLEIFEELLAGVRRQQAIAGETPAFLGVDAGPNGAGAQSTPQFELPELLPVPVDPSSAGELLDAFLRHCLEGSAFVGDELFHFCIFKWMTQHGLPAYRYNSPYVAGYLETHADDQPELLCRFYQHRGRWAEACDAYLALAQGVRRGSRQAGGQQAGLTKEEQIKLLQSAALCAQMPGSNRRSEPISQAILELVKFNSGPVGDQQEHSFGA